MSRGLLLLLLFHPLVHTPPAEEVPARCHYGLVGCFYAYVALKRTTFRPSLVIQWFTFLLIGLFMNLFGLIRTVLLIQGLLLRRNPTSPLTKSSISPHRNPLSGPHIIYNHFVWQLWIDFLSSRSLFSLFCFLFFGIFVQFLHL